MLSGTDGLLRFQSWLSQIRVNTMTVVELCSRQICERVLFDVATREKSEKLFPSRTKIFVCDDNIT